MDLDLDDLVTEKEDALSMFQATADRPGRMNETVEEKITQCTCLIATLSRIREELETQRDDNARVRGKILDLMGVPAKVEAVLDDKSTRTDGTDDRDTAAE